ncbi:hypothetical protein M0804_012115 [Polistes exclamans]|nr:hypothetical protein M0804_012115 [Polistes exclamans]
MVDGEYNNSRTGITCITGGNVGTTWTGCYWHGMLAKEKRAAAGGSGGVGRFSRHRPNKCAVFSGLPRRWRARDDDLVSIGSTLPWGRVKSFPVGVDWRGPKPTLSVC